MTDRRLRPADTADVEAIARIWHDGWHDGHRGHVPDALHEHRRLDDFRRRVPGRLAATTVATTGSGLVGFVTVLDDEVEQVYVSREARGSGVAGALMADAEARIAQRHPVAWLAVAVGNARARRFYERLGWYDAGPADYQAEITGGTLAVAVRRYEKRVARPASGAFSGAWAALRATVAGLRDEDFARPSGCAGWLVRDLVCHLVIDAQDVLITLVTPAGTAPTRDAVTYWSVAETLPTGDDPLDALTVRLATAYDEPWLLQHHLDDVGAAAGRAAELADPGLRVGTRGEVLTVGEYLRAYVLEWTLHHLDLVAHLPHVAGPPADGLAESRELLEKICGAAFPGSFSDTDALLLATGRRAPIDDDRAAMRELAARLPIVLT
ncbi:GNAT family N-acetyltransferase [Dactylosporangium sp. NBC_01737]|uniref:GNAT family N-acetyltransferase n=1 Tax=Dactylosporangium sp. NBC_01737 TaxID=2975959 RepID=UPI002E110F90|nr:GNAT family N-acetyltransferase [Dactylosporangium sp. NBC_01737]